MKFILVDVWEKNGKYECFPDHEILYFNPTSYLNMAYYKAYPTTDFIVRMYKSNEKSMIQMLKQFSKVVDEFCAQAIVVFQNYFPPEWLVSNFSNLVRSLGCFDDPQKTYLATLPALWAYDTAFYCSPSYSRNLRFEDALKMFGVKNSFWFPYSTTRSSQELIDDVGASWGSRRARVVYIGKCYGDKVDKLAKIDRHIDGRLEVYGKDWPMMGMAGFFGPLRGREFFPKIVKPITDIMRRSIYLTSLIGLNTHLGDAEETGNMRMYEVTMHGALLMCDKAGCDAHAEIFEPDKEAVYYGDIDEAVEKCNYYLRYPEKAVAIAKRGFERAHSVYSSEKVLKSLLDWIAQNQKI